MDFNKLKGEVKMKKIILLICIFSVSILILANGIEPKKDMPKFANSDWEESINISNTSSDSVEPLVGADQEGNACVVWVEFANQKIIYSNTNESGNWENPKKVTQMPMWVEGPSPSFTVQNSGIGHLVYMYRTPQPNYEIFYNSYSSGSWGNNINVSQSRGGSCHPSISVDNNNQYLYLVWMDCSFKEWEIMIGSKKPDESKWFIRTLPLGSHRVYIPEITIDGNGTAHVVWCDRSQIMNSTVWYSKNPQPTDISKWTSPILLSSATNLNFCWPKIASDNEGNVYVVWEDNSKGNMEISFRKKINGGDWEDIENISNSSQTSIQPTIAVDRESEDIYVAWDESVKGIWEIFLKSYQDEDWSEAINLSNSSATSGMPNLSVDASGGVHLVYADKYKGHFEVMYRYKPGRGRVLPPINITLTTEFNKILFFQEELNIIRWESNPSNQPPVTIVNYKIYRKESGQGDETYQLISTEEATTFEYVDHNLSKDKKYTYALTSVDQEGNESKKSDPVSEG